MVILWECLPYLGSELLTESCCQDLCQTNALKLSVIPRVLRLKDTRVMVCEGSIRVQVKSLALSDPTLPPLVLQITELVGIYMLWVGISTKNHGNEQQAILGNLCKDWACAMPPDKAVSAQFLVVKVWKKKGFIRLQPRILQQRLYTDMHMRMLLCRLHNV